MNSEIATASANVARLKARKYLDLAFRAVKKISNDQIPTDPTFLVYPPVESACQLGDLVNRMGWYFPEEHVSSVTIRIPLHREDLNPPNVGDLKPPDCQATYSVDHLEIEFLSTAAAASSMGRADGILLWKARSAISYPLVRHLGKTFIVDPTYYSHRESNTWGAISNQVRDEPPGRSQAVFAEFEREVEGISTAYVFATGPSLAEAFEMEFPDDSIKIVCNSIVKNDRLLSHLEPDVLTFADPVFHFGPSRYADRFRRDAVRTIETHGCLTVVPQRYLGLLTGHYPDTDGRIVGVQARQRSEPNYPTARDLTVMNTGNIMTRFMLPLASAVADEVLIVGADGREPDETYFWQHSDDAQYDDELMKTAFTCHPAFFRDRVYEDYYDRHVSTLTRMIEYGEQAGIEYRSLTESYIPCLAERTVNRTTARGG